MEKVRFVLEGKNQEVQTQLPMEAIRNLFVGEDIQIAYGDISYQTINLPDKTDVNFTVTGNRSWNTDAWEVPVKQQVSFSTNLSQSK